jgi:hypothetical protein
MFACELCDYITNRSTNLNKHNKTEKHISALITSQKNDGITFKLETLMLCKEIVLQNSSKPKIQKMIESFDEQQDKLHENYDTFGGHMYCLYNKVFNHYGNNYYKLGKSKNIDIRIDGYTTSYIDKSVIKIRSNFIRNRHLAELVLFDILKKYRCKENREFFKCDLKTIQNTFAKVEKIFTDNTNDDDIKKIYKLELSCEVCGYTASSFLNIKSHNDSSRHIINAYVYKNINNANNVNNVINDVNNVINDVNNVINDVNNIVNDVNNIVNDTKNEISKVFDTIVENEKKPRKKTNKSKYTITENVDGISVETKKYICECKKQFSARQNLWKHKQTCDGTNEFEDMKEQLRLLQNTVTELTTIVKNKQQKEEKKNNVVYKKIST